jgi:hypothetical protein
MRGHDHDVAIAWQVLGGEQWNAWRPVGADRGPVCPDGHYVVFPVVLVDGVEFVEGLAGDVVFLPEECDAGAVIDSELRADLNGDLDARLGPLHHSTGLRSP